MKINIIKFWVKSPLIISMLGLFVATICLYALAALPVIDKTIDANRELEDKKREMEGFLANPPSQKRITRLGEQKEMLQGQYLEVVKKMGFPRPASLSNLPAHFDFPDIETLIDSVGIGVAKILREYFEEELSEREVVLRHLGERQGLTIPSRLGFEEEKPETPQALALLLAGVEAVERLTTIAIAQGVHEILSIEAPSIPYKEGITPDFKELSITLAIKTDALALIELLDELITGEYFFIIEEMEVVSTPAHLEVSLSVSTQIFLEEI